VGVRRFPPSNRVLDIGSPKPFCLYLAESVGAKVHATDIEPYFVNEYKALRDGRGISPERLTPRLPTAARCRTPRAISTGFTRSRYSSTSLARGTVIACGRWLACSPLAESAC
jgi:hypothetical protein